MVDHFLESHQKPPRQIILDADATDDPLHGNQEGRFYHGYYGHYCYLPLYIFCEEFLLCARLRRSNIDASAGTVEELERIVNQIREKWPKVRIILRGDSGFCREAILSWCESHGIDYVLGLAKNNVLISKLEKELEKAEKKFKKTGHAVRFFKDFHYSTINSWSRKRRVIGKAEHLLDVARAKLADRKRGHHETGMRSFFLEHLYCARGDIPTLLQSNTEKSGLEVIEIERSLRIFHLQKRLQPVPENSETGCILLKTKSRVERI